MIHDPLMKLDGAFGMVLKRLRRARDSSVEDNGGEV